MIRAMAQISRAIRRAGLLALLAAAGLPASSAARQADAPTIVSASPVADATWSGPVSVKTTIDIPDRVTLTIAPGAEVRFDAGARLQVLGTLRAAGTAELPIVFRAALEDAAPGSWTGIALRNPGAGSVLRHCRVLGAQEVLVSAGAPAVEDCEISGGVRGVVATGKESSPRIARNRLFDLAEGGIAGMNGASPVFADNKVERCGSSGISATQGAVAEIVGNTVTGCANGIEISRSEPLVRDNTVRRCTRGIALTYAGGGRPVQGNRLEENETGVYIQQYSAPEIRGNLVVGGKQGIFCFMGASPLIAGNVVRGAEVGVLCDQLAAPVIEANQLAENGIGIVLNLSSYATVRGNNLVGNRVQMELGNMSMDWERRVGSKPTRGRLRQNLGRAEKGQDVPQAGATDGFDTSSGLVDARDNWWGEETTREMAAKGAQANIAGLVDGYDVPVRTYEGYEGEFVQDRITYAPWAEKAFALPAVPR